MNTPAEKNCRMRRPGPAAIDGSLGHVVQQPPWILIALGVDSLIRIASSKHSIWFCSRARYA